MQIIRFIGEVEFIFRLWIYGTLGFYYAMKFIGYGVPASHSNT